MSDPNHPNESGQPGNQPQHEQPQFGQPQQPAHQPEHQQPPAYGQQPQQHSQPPQQYGQQQQYGQPQQYGQQQPQQYGQPAYANQGYPAQSTWNVLAIVGFVLAFVVSLGAVICGHIALSQIKRTGEKGHGLALAAVILGYIGILAGIVIIIIYIVVIAAIVQNGGTSDFGSGAIGSFIGALAGR